MEEQPAISTVHLRRSFPARDRKLPRLLGRRPPEFCALDDVCLSVPSGQTLGILGDDGAGKSTFLRLISGALAPSSGDVKTSGRIRPVIEAGRAATGRSTALSYIMRTASEVNIRRRQVRGKLAEIMECSGISDLKRPLEARASSTGVRLSFATAVTLDPQILLLDDCLALTDPLFQQKCMDRLGRLKTEGVTILFVSQNLDLIRALCDRAILLEAGRLVADGSTSEVTEAYLHSLNQRSGGLIHAPVPAFSKAYRRTGSGPAKIKDIRLEDNEGKAVTRLLTGCRYRFRLGICVESQVEDLTGEILICDKFGSQVFGTNTQNHGLAFGALAAGQSTDVLFEVDAFLAPGDYFLTAALHSGGNHFRDCYDWIDNALHFEVLPRGPQRKGAVWLPSRVRIILK